MKLRRRAGRVILVALALVAVLCAAPALAVGAAPSLTITRPQQGSYTNSATPTFAGTTNETSEPFEPIAVEIYEGSSATGIPKQILTINPLSESWEATAQSSLAAGEYTALVLQSNGLLEEGDASVTFTIDKTPPAVSLDPVSSPSKDATPTLTGEAGVAPGDKPSVAVTIYSGSSAGGEVVAAASVSASGSSWSYPAPQLLPDGTYTAQAAQEDEAGNVGESAARTFTVDTTAPVVTINQPKLHSSDSTPTLSGVAGELPGDDVTVRVTIYSGTLPSGIIEQAESAVAVHGSGEWSFKAAQLPDGTYTAQAVQEDDAGNVGTSTPVTFTIETNAPTVSIGPVLSPSNDATPKLSGGAAVAAGDIQEVRLSIYKGTVIANPVEEAHMIVSEGHWSHTTAHLPDGTYTAQVEQEDLAKNRGASEITFVVDTKPPELTLTGPVNDAVLEGALPTFSGLAGTEKGDRNVVALKLYTGTAAAGAPIQSLQITPAGSTWTSGSAGPALANGIYTVVAEQSDDAGNTTKRTATFAIAVPLGPPVTRPSPPTASFQWFPATPRVGEQVSLVSTSTDAASITAFAWGLSAGAALLPGQHLLMTSFSTAGAHPVRLHVTDANGLSGEVAETIIVAPAQLTLMQPFPVVRIAGSARSATIKISLFTVQAPVGATVSVSCHGHGCPTKGQRFVVASKAKPSGTVLVSFGRFERSLRAGAVLEIRVFMHGKIGKYTRFTVRHGKLPARLDTCLNPAGTQPMSCPS